MRTQDTNYMRRAIRLAQRGRGLASPNPPVGALIVRDGTVVGQGFHRGPGTAHAEIAAIDAAGDACRGATLYLTLEPCTHQGRTPPCAPRVIEAGFARVVVGTTDPNPLVDGRGVAALRDAGIDVEAGVLEADAERLIEAFSRFIRTGRPFVTAKVAVSLDGRAAAADGSSQWITGPAARRDAHHLRADSDAVVVGVGTVVRDDPHLTVRLRGYKGRQPLRVVLDSSCRVPLDAAILGGEAPTLVATTDKATEDAVGALRATGVEVLRVPARDGRVDLPALLEMLGKRGVASLLVEGGPTVMGDVVERGLADRYIFYVAPKLLGSGGLGAISALVAPTISDARELRIESVRHVGADIRIEAYPRKVREG
jgi:diaminohydroxyphosphoribosylaminopyrimidine deaminase / 5-amino-6-(5-phosphoribosylamino)uracil reductase